MGVEWSNQLSKRLEILNTVYPLIQIKDYPKRSPRFRELTDFYDPLAIILLIIEDISNTFDISSGAEMTIDHDTLIQDILPFLKEIDEKRGQKIDEDLQIEYIEAIIERLCSKGAEFHQIKFIDYTDPELSMRTSTLEILYTHTQKDRTINYRLNPSIINLLANIGTDIPLDSQVEYNKIILEKQIEEQKIDKAMEIMKKQIKDSRTYYSKVISIIDTIKQNYESKVWREKHREQLEEVEAHLEEWVHWQKHLNGMINTYFFDIPKEEIEEYIKIKKLKELVSESHGIFIKLFKIVKEARETFYKEHFRQSLFTSSLPVEFGLDDKIMEKAIELSVNKQKPLTHYLFNNYSHIHVEKLHSLQNVTRYLFTDYTRSGSKQVERSTNIEDRPIEYFEKFDDKLIQGAINIFLEYLQQHKTSSLVDFLDYASKKDIDYQKIVIILLNLQLFDINAKKTKLPALRLEKGEEFKFKYDGHQITGTNVQVELIL